MDKAHVFKNGSLQKEFDENGFVKFRMFSAEQVEKLHNYYLSTQQEHETVIDKRKFHATNDTDNEHLIADADKFIKTILFEELDKHFFNYKTIAANYLVKQPDDKSELGPHQDLRFVDEQKYYSFNLWVATQPTTKANGSLRFLKGSHLFYDTVRPLPNYPWKYRNVSDVILRYFTDVTTQIGDCVVLNHACIHASYPNLSSQIRIAAILAMVPKEAEIVHYFLPEGNSENLVEKYAMTLEDFVNLKGGQRPKKAPLIEKFKYDFSPVKPIDFLNRLKSSNKNEKSTMNNGYEFAKQKVSALFKIVK